MPSRRLGYVPRALAALFALTLSLALPSIALAASSASFQIQGAAIDTAGGASASASYRVTACVGSEIAGSSASASHRIDSGCGATALFVTPQGGGNGGNPANGAAAGIPTLSEARLWLLVALIGVLALVTLRRRR